MDLERTKKDLRDTSSFVNRKKNRRCRQEKEERQDTEYTPRKRTSSSPILLGIPCWVQFPSDASHPSISKRTSTLKRLPRVFYWCIILTEETSSLFSLSLSWNLVSSLLMLFFDVDLEHHSSSVTTPFAVCLPNQFIFFFEITQHSKVAWYSCCFTKTYIKM